MHKSPLYLAIHYFPYWGVPVLLVFAETGRFAKRRRRKGLMIGCFFLVLIFALAIGLWFYYAGYANTDVWVQSISG